MAAHATAVLHFIKNSMTHLPTVVPNALGGKIAQLVLHPQSVQTHFGTITKVGIRSGIIRSVSICDCRIRLSNCRQPRSNFLYELDITRSVKSGVGRYCVDDTTALDLLVPTGTLSNYWADKTLAECCRNNFPWPESFTLCMSDLEDVRLPDITLPPCSPSPWGNRTNKWYFVDSDAKCVQECDDGASCDGKALGIGTLYDTFDDCCDTHLSLAENSPCPRCSDTYWEGYLSSPSASAMGFHPICKCL